MKVLFSISLPFFLAHGGTKTLMESLMRELKLLGVEVEQERWWDENQKGQIIHYFTRPAGQNIYFAHQKGFKVVLTDNMGQAASRGRVGLAGQLAVMSLARLILPGAFLGRLGWDAYRELDAMVFNVKNEWDVAQFLHRATPGRGHIIPLGLEGEAIGQLARPQTEEDYLVCMATIRSVKNSVLLAQAARIAQTPIVFLGNPYSTTDPYFREFMNLVDGKIVRYPGFAAGEEKFRWLRGARGFALLSQYESGCIAIQEAAAAGLPLFLSNLAWANKVYQDVSGTTFVRLGSANAIASTLRAFYDRSHRQSKPIFPVPTWRQVAEKYLEVYQTIIA